MRALRRYAGNAAVYGVGILLFTAYPRSTRWAYVPGFSPPSRVVRFVVLRWAVTFAAFHWFSPRMTARVQRWDTATEQLTRQLGRQPTPEEYFENWRRTQAAWKAAGRPR